MMGLQLIAALMASVIQAPAGTQAARPATSTEAPAKPAANKKVCKRVVPTGSIMAVTSCRSQKEWNDLSEGGQDTARQVRERAAATMGQPTD